MSTRKIVAPKTTRRDSGGQEGRMGGIVVRKVGGMDSFCCSVKKIKKFDFGKEDNFGSMISCFLEI
jgi:hypothetical protein